MNALRSATRAALALALAVGGCSTPTSTMPPPAASISGTVGISGARQAQKRPRASARLVVHIPRRVRRKHLFVSPSTQSLAYTIVPGAQCGTCSGPTSGDVGLTPSSPNCAAAYNGTTCTILLVIAPGNYVGSISTYDGPAGCQSYTPPCNTLSANQSFPMTILAGQANEPSIALYGVPKGFKVFPVGTNVAESGSLYSATLYVGGINSTGTFQLYATDPDGNLILGPGSPTFVAPSPPPAGWTATLKGNLLELGTGAAFHASTLGSPFPVNAQGPGCSVTGSHCSFATYPYIDPQLAVADRSNSEVHLYYANNTQAGFSSFATISNGISSPDDVTFNDCNGDLFVSNVGSGGASPTVTVYAPPYTGAPVATISVPVVPTHLAVDCAGDVAVASAFLFSHAMTVYTAASSYQSSQSIAISSPATALAFDNNPNLWVATASSIGAYAPPYGGAPSRSLSVSNTTAMSFDYWYDLYVADSPAGTVTEYLVNSSYAAGPSVGSLNQPSSVSAGFDVEVCSVGAATMYYFASSAQLSGAIETGGSTPCLAVNDSKFDHWAASANGPSSTALYLSNGFGYLSYTASAIAAFPSARY